MAADEVDSITPKLYQGGHDRILELTFFFPPAGLCSLSPPCISAIISLNIFSLTPPPLAAAECSGIMVGIFHPFGIAGGGGASVGCGKPGTFNLSGDSLVVG